MYYLLNIHNNQILMIIMHHIMAYEIKKSEFLSKFYYELKVT